MVLGLTIVVWSAMTVMGGFAQSFWQLAATRLGVALGEAGATPAAHGLIAEHFPEHRRALALSVFAATASVGTMMGFAGGGWLVAHYPWRMVLMLVGLPGLLLGPLVLLTVRDRPKASLAPAGLSAIETGVVSRLLSRAAFRHTMAGYTLVATASYALASFQAPLFARIYGWNPIQIGFALGMLYGVAGGLGTLFGGILSDLLGRHDCRWRVWIAGIGTLFAAPCVFAACLAHDGRTAMILMSGAVFGMMVHFAPTFAVAQGLTSSRGRSTASALLLVASGLIGGGTGPLLIGSASDVLAHWHVAGSVRFALLLVVPLDIWSAVHFYWAGRALPGDLERELA
jgi:MFS family permease